MLSAEIKIKTGLKGETRLAIIGHELGHALSALEVIATSDAI